MKAFPLQQQPDFEMRAAWWFIICIKVPSILSLHQTFEFRNLGEPETKDASGVVVSLNRDILPAFALRPGDDANHAVAQLSQIAQDLNMIIPEEVGYLHTLARCHQEGICCIIMIP